MMTSQTFYVSEVALLCHLDADKKLKVIEAGLATLDVLIVDGSEYRVKPFNLYKLEFVGTL